METQIAEYSPATEALAELRKKYAKAVFDTSTPAGMAKAIAARRELREVRVKLEKLRKELKAPALERSRLIDAEAKMLTVQIEEMEKPIDDQIKAEEQRKAEEKAERERIEREKLEALQRRVANILQQAVKCVGMSSTEIAAKLESLAAFEPGEDFGVLQGAAHAAKTETLATLADMHAAALAQEAEAERLRIEREELEAQRKAQEEKAAQDRAEAEARQRAAEEKARIEREAIEAERRKQEEEAAALRAAEDAKRAEEERKAAAIRDAEEAELARQRAEIEEQRRAVEEAARKVQSGYEALQSFVDRFGAEKEFSTIAKQISKWLAAKNQEAA